MKKRNLKGKRFGRLVVLGEIEKEKKNDRVRWLCKCDCGKTVEISSKNLRLGNTQSCGCLQREKARKWAKKLSEKYNIKHGDARRDIRHKLYRIWTSMLSRCMNPDHDRYKSYGKRNISVCEEWRKSYLAFKFWALVHDWKEGLSIDRIDNSGNYEPNNCQFLTLSENTKKAHGDRKFKKMVR